MADGSFELNTAAVPGMVLPFSAEAEQSVLGAVLLEPSCLSTVAELLPRAEYFYQVNNRLIYSVMLEMFTAGKPVDLVTLLAPALKTPVSPVRAGVRATNARRLAIHLGNNRKGGPAQAVEHVMQRLKRGVLLGGGIRVPKAAENLGERGQA